jgi:hypothetical protein
MERNHINAFHNAIHTFEVLTMVTHLTTTMADLTPYDKTILQCAALCLTTNGRCVISSVKNRTPIKAYISISSKRTRTTNLCTSTDLKYHAHYLNIIRSNTKIGNMIRVIKIADLSHPLRPFHVHVQDSRRTTPNSSHVASRNRI